MKHKKYTDGDELSEAELGAISEKLIQAKFDREKRKAWEQRLKDEHGVEKEVSQTKSRFSFSKLAIAAVVISIMGIVTYSIATFNNTSHESIVQDAIENLISIDNHAVVTRGDTVVNAQVLQAITAYKNKKYDKSIEHWEAIITSGKIKGFASYNMALCYLQKKPSDAEKAISYLLEARKTKTVQQEANWALALAYLAIDEKAKAKDILQQIVDTESYKYKKAKQLIDLL